MNNKDKIQEALNFSFEPRETYIFEYTCPECGKSVLQYISDPYWVGNIVCPNCIVEMDWVSELNKGDSDE